MTRSTTDYSQWLVRKRKCLISRERHRIRLWREEKRKENHEWSRVQSMKKKADTWRLIAIVRYVKVFIWHILSDWTDDQERKRQRERKRKKEQNRAIHQGVPQIVSLVGHSCLILQNYVSFSLICCFFIDWLIDSSKMNDKLFVCEKEERTKRAKRRKKR